ncbi:hypothetical protein [Roseateles aquatilis]|nr:hypothetical protein [Roseateles aquatilis]
MDTVSQTSDSPTPAQYASLEPDPGFRCSDDFLQHLRENNKRFRRERFAEGDMFTVEQAASMIGQTAEQVLELVHSGRALGLVNEQGELRLPFWQFYDSLWPHLPTIKADCVSASEPWGLLNYLESPSRGLREKTPRIALEQGHLDDVLRDARWGPTF